MFEKKPYELFCGNSLEVLKTLPENSIDSIVTDPPYEIDFMGKKWDSSGIAYNTELWTECMRVLKPGGMLLAFGATRTYHRMVVAIEDSGLAIKNQLGWMFGSGFPKGLNIGKAIDDKFGLTREVIGKRKFPDGSEARATSRTGGFNEDKGQAVVTAPASPEAKQWEGWNTQLKPAFEPICLAQKPLEGNYVDNILKWGVGGLNIDGCRIGIESGDDIFAKNPHTVGGFGHADAKVYGDSEGSLFSASNGRYPSNLIIDDSEEVSELFPDGQGNSGSTSRFFYVAKTNKQDRNEGLETPNGHLTVKPTELMRYLVRLITPKGGVVLDPFNGSGSTGKACMYEGIRAPV